VHDAKKARKKNGRFCKVFVVAAGAMGPQDRKFFSEMAADLIEAPPAVPRRDPAINKWCNDYQAEVAREYKRRLAEIEDHSRRATEVRVKRLLYQLREEMERLRKHVVRPGFKLIMLYSKNLFKSS
jgi:hypothetical protein